MPILPYVTDNPFRLLGVGSATLIPDLRRLAKRATQAAKVGIIEDTGLVEILGADDLIRCGDLVRELAADPMTRTIHRLCWALRFSPSTSRLQSVEDIAPSPDAPQGEQAQCSFLRHWITFGLRPSQHDLAGALSSFRVLYETGEHDHYLANLLVKEGMPESDALTCVYEAQEKLIGHLLETACLRGVDLMERGDVTTALALIEAVRDSDFDEDWIDKALLRVVPAGEREMSAVRQSMEENAHWTPTSPYYDGADICKLSALAEALAGRHPAAVHWRQTADDRLLQVATQMREYAINLAYSQRDYAQALEVLAHVHRLPLSPDWLQRVQDDILVIGIKQEADESETLARETHRRRSEALADTCRHAMMLWEAGYRDEALGLLSSMCQSAEYAFALKDALQAVRAVGDTETDRIQKDILAFEGWKPGDDEIELDQVTDLRRLAAVVSGHIPVGHWVETCDQRIRQVAVAMRNCAIDLANENYRYEEASRILRRVASLDLPPDVRRRVDEDVRDLEKILANQRMYAGLRPVKSPPSLYTINGIGTKLYGSRKFEGREGWYYKTLYFVIFFLPVLPLKQYLVSDAPGGGWYFHATAPFGRRNRYHMAGALATVLGLFVWAVVTSNRSYSVSPSFPDAASSAPPPTAAALTNSAVPWSQTQVTAPAAPGQDSTPPPVDQPSAEVLNLRAEYEALKDETTSESVTLDAERDIVLSEIRLLKLVGATLDTTDQAAVDAYNERVRAANARKDAFNRKVRKHNDRVRRLNRVVNRLRALGE